MPGIDPTNGIPSQVYGALEVGGNNPHATLTFTQALTNPVLGTPSVDAIASTMYNPTLFSDAVKNQTLLGSELASFARFYYNTFMVPTNDSTLRYLYDNKFAQSLLMLLHAKQTFNNAVFGTFGNGSMYAQPIRPVTWYASTGTAEQNWLESSVTAGWNTKFWSVNLSYTNTATNLNVKDHVEMIVFGFADFAASPKLFEYQFSENGQVPLGVHSKPLIQVKDSNAIVLDEQAIAIPNDKLYTIDVNFLAAGASIPVPQGIQFVDTIYLLSE